jgi:FAD/FMN-containing dehydrogenase
MFPQDQLLSWGRYPKVIQRGAFYPRTVKEVRKYLGTTDGLLLPRGMGRSYGDICLNEGGYLLSSKFLNKMIDFNPERGLLKCEGGTTIDEIIRFALPRGWFPPVTPGTKYVTVGGAIANDVHGKNHHMAGTFCNHVESMAIQRSDGSIITCSRTKNREWFRATTGGIGLTGVIIWAEIRLKKVHGPYISFETVKFDNLDEFYQISDDSIGHEYTVSWLDCLDNNFRGIFIRGKHSDRKESDPSKLLHSGPNWKTVPCDAPQFLLSYPTIKFFNNLYFIKQFHRVKKSTSHYDPFFYPLDGIGNWNRLYGHRGFLQWQCVVPSSNRQSITSILKKIKKSYIGSFLVVIKEFGSLTSDGILSFAMPGITLALDFPNVGSKLFSLLNHLDAIVMEAEGRIYPAKDARMSKKTFLAGFPKFNEMIKYIDPKLSSSFFRRVGT